MDLKVEGGRQGESERNGRGNRERIDVREKGGIGGWRDSREGRRTEGGNWEGRKKDMKE